MGFMGDATGLYAYGKSNKQLVPAIVPQLTIMSIRRMTHEDDKYR